MFGLLTWPFKLLKNAIKSVVALVIVAFFGLAYLEYRVAAGKLPQADGAVVTTGLCRTTPSISGGTLPLTYQAFVKDGRGPNWLDSGGPAGLVRARLEWSHGGFRWVEDTGFAERQADAVKKRQALASRDPGELVKDLRSDDPIAREVAAKELFLLTGQTFGYAYDASREDRDKAAAAWEKWWADDLHKATSRGKRVLDRGKSFIDGAEKVLETLRKYDQEKK
ncbi:MAG TPA: hypothetical protein VHF22_15405 [Planctomycetota bacterium]|nr:hypothetical protein [Planctomycetota bacterium]